jgi:hypothetical protein
VLPTPIDVTTTGNVAREIDVTFTADGDTVVLAWGGHIASTLNWGAGNTYAGGKSGASFHMQLRSTDSIHAGTQSLPIHGDVTALPPSFSTHVTPSSVAIGEPVIDTATLRGTSGQPPRGSVAFLACFDTASPPGCSTRGTAAGQSAVIVSRARAGSNGVAFRRVRPGHAGLLLLPRRVHAER